MPKYFVSQESPLRYNADGQTADGFSWFESEETDEIRAALKRRGVFRIDSDGEIVYDSIEETKDNSDVSDEPLSPENAGKKNSPRKKLEG